ncbi:MAG: hypothetical protein N4R28_05515 [Lactobacillus iners]|nr:hypothetical protein [Lactobacillus iners]MCT7782823.1 hypothetical protein [Lactobacillus iners]
MFVKTAHAKIRQSQRNILNIDIEKALRNPIHKESIITDELGRKSQKIIGDFTTVVINPDTMEVIITYPTKKSKRQRYLKIDKCMFTKEEIKYMKSLGLNLDFHKPLLNEGYERIEDIVTHQLQVYGFDKNYNPTTIGILCENILDKFD